MMQEAMEHADHDDAELMLAYRDGDVQAFEKLYNRHRAALYRFICHSCDNTARASELYQDVWASIIDARHAYEPSTPFIAWMYKIARNRLIDHYRRQGRKPATQTFDEDNNAGVAQLHTELQPDEIAIIEQNRETLQQALELLPEKQREAILLKHVAGMSIDEIANTQQQKNETVKSRLRYAMKALRTQLRQAARSEA